MITRKDRPETLNSAALLRLIKAHIMQSSSCSRVEDFIVVVQLHNEIL